MRLYALIITILLTASCVNRPSYRELEYDNSELQYRVEELEDKIEELEDKYRCLIFEYEEIKSERDELEDIVERAKSACIIWNEDAYMALRILNEY